jgi:hypothetical protein
MPGLPHSKFAPDLSRVPEAFRTEMLRWILAFSGRFAEMEKLNSVIRQNKVLQTGKQFLRPTSENGVDFHFPTDDIPRNPIFAWSIILDEKEILCGVNLNPGKEEIAYVTVDNDLHAIDSKMKNLYASATCPSELNIEERNGKAIRLTIPPYGLVVYGWL